MLSTVIIIFVVSLAAMLLARLFVRPIRRLQAGAQQISGGDYRVALPVLSRDEFGDLTTAFNDMSRNLSIKDELLGEERAENQRLMLSLMPEPVMQRYLDGEETIAQDHKNVTVIFADMMGLDELSRMLTSEELMVIVNDLTRQFDAAAESLGVDHVRTLHNGYLASCGLGVPRLDNVRRTVDFAIEMDRIIDRYAAESGHDLRLRAGIDTGSAASGLVGRSTLAYDMWGSAVDVAYQVQRGSPQPGIYVTSRVHEVMQDNSRLRRRRGGRRRARRRDGLATAGPPAMSSVLNSTWLAWAVAVAVGFPVLLVVLTEVHNALRRRGSALARPVQLLRTYILPLGALLLLLVQAMEISDDATSVRLVATLFGVVLLTLVLSGLNATLIQGAPEDSWRRRIPSIFLDVARFALIAVGITVIMAYVWGANVGGLFTALGVTSIVLGLALQNSVGQIISGLLLLFEQPFRLGDWITVPTAAGRPSAHGRVVEVNWRATHIDTGGNLLVMPNAELAGASFTNYSRPVGEHRLTVVTTFDAADTAR